MAIALGTASNLTEHAVCVAAGVRDGLRTAQFYMRDLARAGRPEKATVLSRIVGRTASALDWLLEQGAIWSTRIFLPQWRDLPSPFAPGMHAEVLEAIRQNRLVRTSLFTAYFFRAARHVLEQCTHAPHLVLEHRVDAARRTMAADSGSSTDPLKTLALALLHLVEADAVARAGGPKPAFRQFQNADMNIAVMATACLALLLAEGGKPIESVDEDDFFAITAALLSPRLSAMQSAVKARDVVALARELEAVKELY